MSTTVTMKQDPSADWTSRNPVLAQFEIGIESDTGKAKIGDGRTSWTGLGYFDPAGGGDLASGAITGKNAVSAATGDYVLISDVSDSDNLKKATVQSIIDLVPASGASIGGTVTSATAGSVFFAGAAGVMAQDNAGFFYDDTNNQLKLTASAATQTPLQINLASAQSANALEVKNSGGTTLFAIEDDGRLLIPDGSFFTGGASLRFNGGGGLYRASNMVVMSAGDNLEAAITSGSFQVGKDIQIGWSNAAGVLNSTDVGFARTAAGIVKITNGSTGAGALHLQEQTAPSAPAANNVYIYAQDNGAGKTQLMALFPSGVAQQIAIEP